MAQYTSPQQVGVAFLTTTHHPNFLDEGYIVAESHPLDHHTFQSVLPLAARQVDPERLEHLRASLAGPLKNWEDLDHADLIMCEGAERAEEVERGLEMMVAEIRQLLRERAGGLVAGVRFSGVGRNASRGED